MRSIATITSGGSSESELKELTVRPCGLPSAARVVSTATPVVKRPQARRKSRESNSALDTEITLILSWSFGLLFWEAELIKLDIINEVVNRTGITKTKAEMAVETVFE